MKRDSWRCTVGAVAMFATTAPALAADPFVGTWVLNLAKSSYSPGPAPATETVTIRDIGNGKFEAIIDVKDRDGKASHLEIVYANDGADYPIIGPVQGQSATSKYIDA